MKKRLLSLALVLTMICSLFTAIPVSAASMFSDVNGHWAQATIEELASKGIINGKGAGLYDPEGKVTRAEFAKLLVCTGDYEDYSAIESISDVKENDWYTPYVSATIQQGVFSEDELNGGKFEPDAQIDRDTVALWMTRYIGIEGTDNNTVFADNSKITNKNAVATAYSEGLITGDGGTNTFRPKDGLSRAEAANRVKRFMTKVADMNTPRVSKNLVDFNDEVIDVESDERTNIVVEDTDKYAILDNINDSVKNLKEGDVFKIDASEELPTGLAIKVKSIEVTGSKAKIYKDANLTIEDLYEEIDISTTVNVGLDDIQEGTLAAGISVTNDKNQTIAMAKQENKDNANNGYYLADNGNVYLASNTSGVGVSETLRYSLSYTLGEKKNSSGSLGAKAVVSGSVATNLSFSVDAKYSFWKGLELIDVKATVDNSINLGISGSVSAEAKIPMGSVVVALGPTGLFVVGDLSFVVGVDGKVELVFEIKKTNVAGGKYENGNITLYKTNKGSVSLEGSAEVEIKAGPQIEAGIEFLGEVIKVSDTIEGGVKASFKSAIDASAGVEGGGHLSVGKDGVSVGANANAEAEIHACMLCISGDLDLYASNNFKVNFKAFKWNWTPVDMSKEVSADIGSCHISKYTSDSNWIFEWGDCNNYKKASVEVGVEAGFDGNGEPYFEPDFSPEVVSGGTQTATMATKTTKTGNVSEDIMDSSFDYTAPSTGTYYFVNNGPKQVLITIDGECKTNEGYFDLKAGKTYKVIVSWRLDDTNYSLDIFAPAKEENITGSSTVNGKFIFKGEVKKFKYIPRSSGEYVLDAGEGTQVVIKDASGNQIAAGNPNAVVTMTEGVEYKIELSAPSVETKSFIFKIMK